MRATLHEVTSFANRLDAAHINYRLEIVRTGGIMFCIAVPGERWEVEFREDGTVEVEVFRSDGTLSDEGAIERLFQQFSDA
jgi:hypothetical protein